MSASTRFRYETLLEQLHDFGCMLSANGAASVVTLSLDEEAHRLFLAFRDEMERGLGEFGTLAGISEWAAKLPGAVARTAGLLHVAAHPGRPAADPVTADAIAGAIEIGRYLTGHARAAYAVMGADKALADAKHILRWIERHGLAEFSERDAYRALSSRFKHPADLHPGLTALEGRSYVRRRPEPRAKGPGRRPSPRWEVNPEVARRNRQN